MKTVRLLFILLFTIVQHNSFANIDSLKKAFKGSSVDSIRAKTLLEIGDAYRRSNLDTAEFYYLKALDLAKCDNCELSLAAAYTQLGILYAFKKDSNAVGTFKNSLELYAKGDNTRKLCIAHRNLGEMLIRYDKIDEAKSSFRKTISLAQSINFYNQISIAHTNMGYVFAGKSLYDSSAFHLQKALDYRQKAGLNPSETSLLNMGAIYFKTGNTTRALEYYKKALETAIESNNIPIQAKCFQNMGALFTEIEDYDLAIENWNKAFEIYKEKKDSSSMSTYYTGLADIDKAQKNNDAALDNYLKAAQVFPKNGNISRRVFVHINLARAYLNIYNGTNKQVLKNVIEEGLNGYFSAVKVQNTLSQMEASEILFKAYNWVGQYKNASEYAKIAIELQDSLYNKQRVDAIANMQEKYETEKKELKIQLLDKENEIKQTELTKAQLASSRKNYFILGVLIVCLLIITLALLLYIQANQRKKTNAELTSKNELISRRDTEKELLLKEIHHRVKNNLQVISSLLELQAKKVSDTESEVFKEGQSRVRAMALIHEELYQNNNLAEVDFKAYTAKLSRQIQSLFPGKEKVAISIEGPVIKLDIDTAIPLGLIINELVTNSFKYGLGESGLLSINFKELEKGNYSVSVSDSGQGLAKDFDYKKSRSLGLRLVNRLTKQLYGKVDYSNNENSTFEISFKDTIERKKVA